MKVTIKGGKMTIELDMQREVSASGKSIVLATTKGNQPAGVEVEGQQLIVGVNAYIKNTGR